jgi:hypothetical protein
MNLTSDPLQGRPRRGISILYESVRFQSLINQNMEKDRDINTQETHSAPPSALDTHLAWNGHQGHLTLIGILCRSHTHRRDVGIPRRNLLTRGLSTRPLHADMCRARSRCCSPEQPHLWRKSTIRNSPNLDPEPLRASPKQVRGRGSLL